MIKKTNRHLQDNPKRGCSAAVNRKTVGSIRTACKPAGKALRNGGTVSKYGTVRPEVREMIKRRLDKHASTWTELAKR